MKQIILLTTISLMSFGSIAQTQLGNSDMENWESVQQGEEPVNWNSFMTASGGFIGFADVQIAQSSHIRPGSTGTKSAVIWSRDAGFGVTANGNMTLGKVNMGAIIASDPANYNWSDTANADHSEAFTDMPDSIAFWVKFVAGGNEQARMKATLHDAYEYRDPEDANSTAEVVASAEVNYSPTDWTRMAVAFDYSGAATNVEYMLVTFTTNMTPGGGSPNDSVYVDDIELIYNQSNIGISEVNTFAVSAFVDNAADLLKFSSEETLDGKYEVYDMNGARVLSGELTPNVPFNQPSGIYIVNVTVGDVSKRFRVYND